MTAGFYVLWNLPKLKKKKKKHPRWFSSKTKAETHWLKYWFKKNVNCVTNFSNCLIIQLLLREMLHLIVKKTSGQPE